ncbi:MAG TPA: hypothetical protein VJR23_19885, partial [Candidatus Acidoferrales bacterium]|nr:hypothetical protein [Candidatus Acidoferrales bacterium]
PLVKTIFMSGYLEYEKELEAISTGSLFVQKPFTRDALVLKLEAALAGPADAPNASRANARAFDEDFLRAPVAPASASNTAIAEDRSHSNGSAANVPANGSGSNAPTNGNRKSTAKSDDPPKHPSFARLS